MKCDLCSNMASQTCVCGTHLCNVCKLDHAHNKDWKLYDK